MRRLRWLLWICALLYEVQKSLGQGLNDDFRNLGAGLDAQAQRSNYDAAVRRSRALVAAFNSKRAGNCAGNSGKLCGVEAVDSDVDRAALLLATSPQEYDSRDPANTGGFDPISPPLDQGDCEACVSFVLAAAAEAAIASAIQKSALTPQTPMLSPRDIFFCSASGVLENDCNSGWTFKDALTALTKKNAISTWNCMPLEADSQDTVSREEFCVPQCAAKSLPGRFQYTWRQPLRTLDSVQEHIRRWGGVATAMKLPSSFRDWFKANPKGVYNITNPSGSTRGHAVFVVGYDNLQQYWIVKNSWSTRWADGGFFKIKFGALGIMDPGNTFGITFMPASGGNTLLQQLLPTLIRVSVPGRKDCYQYYTQPSDYASKVADVFGLPLLDLLNLNSRAILNMTAFLPVGVKLTLCDCTRCSGVSTNAVPTPSPATVTPSPPLQAPNGACAGVDCGQHGVCAGSTGRCACLDGYTGTLCERSPIDACRGVSCGTFGTCLPATGRCVCVTGYTGTYCEVPLQPVDRCQGVLCGAHGVCVSGFCQCSGGWSGAACSQPADPCQGVYCGTHGTCEDGSCKCSGGWGGATCSQPPVDPCEGVSCGRNGACVRGACHCTGGWSGETCSQPPPVALRAGTYSGKIWCGVESNAYDTVSTFTTTASGWQLSLQSVGWGCTWQAVLACAQQGSFCGAGEEAWSCKPLSFSKWDENCWGTTVARVVDMGFCVLPSRSQVRLAVDTPSCAASVGGTLALQA